MLRRREALRRQLCHHRLRRGHRRGRRLELGFKTTEAPDVVTFRVTGNALDTTWGKDGRQAIQSEGTGRPTAEDRGRMALALPGDRTLQVGRFGGIPAAFVARHQRPARRQRQRRRDPRAAARGPRRAVLRRRAVAGRQAHRADDQQPQGRRAAGGPRSRRLTARGDDAARHLAARRRGRVGFPTAVGSLDLEIEQARLPPCPVFSPLSKH